MAAIVVTSLTSTLSAATYRDLLLDLKVNYTKNLQLLKRREVKDIQISEDLGAVKNSLFNLFTTIPGQKILNPIYGLNLTQYLFVPVSQAQARIIGETILKGIQKYEPRVQLSKLNIEVDPDNNQYNVFMLINVPTLNITGVSLKGVLSESGYYFD
jgi:phage baseplate assembly protein W